MSSSPLRRALAAGAGAATLAAALVAGAASAGAAPKPPAPVDVQLLALNDFHGQLEPPTGSSSSLPGVVGAVGGAEYLATQVRRLEAQSKRQNTVTVAAGDLIGASPLLSAAFHDEPAIESLNRIGLDYASVGNHEFDEGPDELLRIQHGGCHPEDGCSDPEMPYEGADFQYLSANAFRTSTQQPLLPPYAVREVEGVKIGFIGLTLEGTPSIVTPSGVAGLGFADEAATANEYAAQLQAQGVQAIVVLMHEGGTQPRGSGINDCTNLTGPVTQIVPQMSQAIDVVITGHTHQAYNCLLDGRRVTSASSVGRLVTDIDLTVDRVTGDVLTVRADNVPVVRTVKADPAQTALIARWRRLLGPLASQEVGNAAEILTRSNGGSLAYLNTAGTATSGATGDSSLGNLIADGQLAATAATSVASLMNPGGVRADIQPGPITYEEAFSVQPFGNFLTQITLTDAQVQCVLEQQFSFSNPVVLQPGNLTYSVSRTGRAGAPATAGDPNAPCAGTVVPDESVRIGGVAIATDQAAEYRFTVNNFLADGGDGFTLLRGGSNRQNVSEPEDDLAAFIDYLGSFAAPTTAPATGRITQVG